MRSFRLDLRATPSAVRRLRVFVRNVRSRSEAFVFEEAQLEVTEPEESAAGLHNKMIGWVL